MKYLGKKIKIAVLTCLCLLGIAGCSAGSTVDTKLNIKKDLSGVREMEVAIDNSVFSENFHGDIDALNAVIENNCPKEITWTHDNSDGVDRYHVQLAFSSPKDYKAKVETIMGKEVQLELSAPDTIWTSGFRIYENFSSTDLLGWLSDALIEAELVNQSDASYIFTNGKAVVVYEETSYDAYSSIQINQLTYLPLDKVDILTNIKDFNMFDRSIIVYIPKASMNLKKAEIEAFLNGNVPAGATSSWEAYENGTKMTIFMENMDMAGLDAFNKKVLASDQNAFVVTEAQADADVFSFANFWDEQINLSSYAGDEDGRVTVGYYLKTESGMTLSRDRDGGQRFDIRDDNTYPAYQVAQSGKASEFTTHFVMNKQYLVQGTQVETNAKGNSFDRTVTFTLAQVPAESDQAVIMERIQELVADLAEASAKTEEDKFSITIKEKGTSEELAEIDKTIFGSSTILRRAKEKGLMSLRHRTAFMESFNYSDFVGITSDDYLLTYKAKMGFLETVYAKSLPQEDIDAPVAKGGTVTYETSRNSVRISFTGSQINIIGAILWMAILAAAAFLGWNLKKSGVPGMVKEDLAQLRAAKKQSGAAGSENIQELPPQVLAQQEAAATVATKVYFCPECGSQYEDGAVFCENCGKKLGDEA